MLEDAIPAARLVALVANATYRPSWLNSAFVQSLLAQFDPFVLTLTKVVIRA